MAEEEQDRVGYTVFYPKGMDEMNYNALRTILRDTMEALEQFVRHDIFNAYYKANTAERQHPFEEGEE